MLFVALALMRSFHRPATNCRNSWKPTQSAAIAGDASPRRELFVTAHAVIFPQALLTFGCKLCCIVWTIFVDLDQSTLLTLRLHISDEPEAATVGRAWIGFVMGHRSGGKPKVVTVPHCYLLGPGFQISGENLVDTEYADIVLIFKEEEKAQVEWITATRASKPGIAEVQSLVLRGSGMRSVQPGRFSLRAIRRTAIKILLRGCERFKKDTVEKQYKCEQNIRTDPFKDLHWATLGQKAGLSMVTERFSRDRSGEWPSSAKVLITGIGETAGEQHYEDDVCILRIDKVFARYLKTGTKKITMHEQNPYWHFGHTHHQTIEWTIKIAVYRKVTHTRLHCEATTLVTSIEAVSERHSRASKYATKSIRPE
ncbi:hypothetical protein CLF_101010 [Clonorchis sinensis]|uniref:Uncharacterized protein n=1 Tax=Clonorchis sinensis TaxID=79923 RepID=G7Y4S1_CLOSI|nr:hypothetical protein CLF_101010 [Clonorchis sinensis]